MFAPTTLRDSNSRSGISGFAMRAWRTTNAREQRDGHRAEHQRLRRAPALLGDLEDRVDAEHQAAGQQHGAGQVGALLQADPGRSSTSRAASHAVTMPIGTLMKKIQCQLMRSVSTPPASRPIEPPAEATKP